MLQSMGLQRVRFDWMTEQQQQQQGINSTYTQIVACDREKEKCRKETA